VDVAPRIRPEYGPSLSELLRRRLSLRARRALGAAAVLVGLALAGWWLWAPEDGRYVHRSEPVFNMRLTERGGLHRVKAEPGEILRLEARRRGRVVQSFTVAPFELPASDVEPAAAMGLLAVARVRDELAPTFDAFTPTDEGKANINDALGYQVGFEAVRDGRTVLGRQALLLDPEGGGREGVVLTAIQEPRGPVRSVADVGAAGPLRVPYRSLRFGTKWP
jgi:hypothetical protein